MPTGPQSSPGVEQPTPGERRDAGSRFAGKVSSRERHQVAADAGRAALRRRRHR